ncbi:DEAD/DEAH box helicase [Roseivirga sp. BDSF3-8]|uniref:DEAD/DEAH box helicase n=1 Tax=Roseivirga sp. BDSF3-8 TaxID=3241598 RepID=UPI0035324C77
MAQDINKFEDFKLNKQLLNAIEEQGYEHPTPIQQKAIPLIQAGHDLLGIAQTGTGKTAAFTLPLLYKLRYAQGSSPRAIILTPTRELAIQIEDEVNKLSTYTDLRTVALYGGKGPKSQKEAVEAGCDLIVATPGRLIDIYKTGALLMKEIKTLVIDEADKMMDMGFMPKIRNVLEVIPVKRQNLLFSATMPDKVVKLSEEFLEWPERVEVTPQATAAETVEQLLYEVPNLKTKINLLEHLLQDKESWTRVIVFTKTRETANNVYKYLSRKLHDDELRVIHANKGQNTRTNAMDNFKEGNIRVLVATDVASRGIDVAEVSHVVNFDIPLIHEDYVHRIGRTGRAEHTGVAISFANEAELFHVKHIEKLIRQPIPRGRIPDEVKIEKTDFAEKQLIAREIDLIKRRENPNFKGAFHEKKRKKDPKAQSHWDARSNKGKRKSGNKGKRRR